jgi:hypothetical protein
MRLRLGESLKVPHFRTFQRSSGSAIATIQGNLLKSSQDSKPAPSGMGIANNLQQVRNFDCR